MGVRKIGLSLASLTPAIPTGSVAHGKRPAGTKKKKQRGKIVMETDMPQDVVDYQGRPVRTTPGTGGTGSAGTAPAPDADKLLEQYFIQHVYRDPNGRGKPLGAPTPHYKQAWDAYRKEWKYEAGKVVPRTPATPAPSMEGIQQLYANPQGAALADLVGKASPVGSPEGLQAQMMKMFFGGQ